MAMLAVYPWQLPFLEQQQTINRDQRVGQAYLLVTSYAQGGHRLAQHMVSGWLCRTASAAACGTCLGCQFDWESHPDVWWVKPDGQQIKVEQIRHLSAHLHLPPSQGRHRVVLVDQAERLNIASSNALLKALEEPAQGTIFLLMAKKANLLIPTIRSRCQILSPAQPSDAAIKSWLLEQGYAAADSWGVDILGGCTAFTDAVKAHRYDELKNMAALWRESLTSQALVPELVLLTKNNLQDSLMVLVSLVHKRLRHQLRQGSLSTARLQSVQAYIAETIRLRHTLTTTATFNTLALCQNLLSQYISASKI
jgi:DNA polymerase-3 subunit delta'